LEWRKLMIECRGIYYQAIKEVFPHITEVLTPELAAHFEGEIDPEAWYDARPYLETVGYLIAHISPDFMALLGGHLAGIAKGNFEQFGVDSTRKLAAILPRIYSNNVRGEEAGEWIVEEYKPGRAIIKETAITANVDFVSGVLRGGLEALGAYNIRISVLDERGAGADANRYLVEWIEPPGSPE
jgi:hypothetical protein